jgi:hypothetical protein
LVLLPGLVYREITLSEILLMLFSLIFQLLCKTLLKQTGFGKFSPFLAEFSL